MTAADVFASWKTVWTEGFVPLFTDEGLIALGSALKNDDHKLTQGSTTTPPPLMCVQDWPCEAADAIAYIGTIANGGFGEATVGQVEEFFARACFEADQRLGEPAACRHFLNWWDDTPRTEAFALVLELITPELTKRGRHEWVARLLCPLVPEAPLGIVADWLDDHDRSDAARPLRTQISLTGEAPSPCP